MDLETKIATCQREILFHLERLERFIKEKDSKKIFDEAWCLRERDVELNSYLDARNLLVK